MKGSLHKKISFPLRISSVNVTRSAVSCGISHIYYLFIYLLICLFVYFLTYLFIYLSIYLFIKTVFKVSI